MVNSELTNNPAPSFSLSSPFFNNQQPKRSSPYQTLTTSSTARFQPKNLTKIQPKTPFLPQNELKLVGKIKQIRLQPYSTPNPPEKPLTAGQQPDQPPNQRLKNIGNHLHNLQNRPTTLCERIPANWSK
uniref:Putative ovule protein n=1 Tax=Solanum chacoense TaxID=4108 RepID=A0A0V0HLJ5_SOLCH